MINLQNGFFSNESRFGKLMTRIGITVGANLMFVLFSLPVFTVGAAWTALCYVMLKTLRTDNAVNPFRLFWIGFKMNFRQATLVWIAAIALFALGAVDVQICLKAGGMIGLFRYPIYAMGIILASILLYLFPVMAAFTDTIPHLIRNSIYFLMHRPWKLVLIGFCVLYPLYQAYTDLTLQPMYAFVYAFFGFGAAALLTAWLLLQEFQVYLPAKENAKRN